MRGKQAILAIIYIGIGISVGFYFREESLTAQTIPSQITPSSTTPSQQGSTSLNSAKPATPIPSSLGGGSSALPIAGQSALFPTSQVAGSSSQDVTPPAVAGVDPTTQSHIFPSGGKGDIAQVGTIAISQQRAYTGDDITFTVNLENLAPYKKFVRSLCFNSQEGNFGCSPGFNLNPGEVLSISNSGRFMSSGVKSIGVSWSQDGENYISPVHASSVSVIIL